MNILTFIIYYLQVATIAYTIALVCRTVKFEPKDIWIGLYWNKYDRFIKFKDKSKRFSRKDYFLKNNLKTIKGIFLYIIFIPMFPIHLDIDFQAKHIDD